MKKINIVILIVCYAISSMQASQKTAVHEVMGNHAMLSPGIYVPELSKIQPPKSKAQEKNMLYAEFEDTYKKMYQKVGQTLLQIINARSYAAGTMPVHIEMEYDDAVVFIKKITGLDLAKSHDYEKVFELLRALYDRKLLDLLERLESPKSTPNRQKALN